MARLPTPNPIDSGYMGRGQCVDHLGSTTIDCKACGSQQRAERYKVILGPTVGFGAPFFVKPFLHRSSTKGMTGRKGIFALCCRCQSFWSEDEGARESLVLQGDDPDGIIAEHMRYEMLNRAAEGLEKPATESGGTETESGAVGLSPTSRVRKLGADTPKEPAVQQPQSVEPTVDVPSVGADGQVDKWVCSDCDSVVSESATVCPSCGVSFDGEQSEDGESQPDGTLETTAYRFGRLGTYKRGSETAIEDSAFGVEDDPEIATLQEALAAREQEIQELEEERRQAEAVEQRKAEAAKRVFELERKLKEADTKLASLKNPSLRVAKVLVQSCTRCKFANVRMPCDLCPECSAEMSIQRGAIQTWRCGKCDMVAGKDASSCTFCEVSFDV